MANSGIIHAGCDPKDGTLKAKLNIEGNKLIEEVCNDLGVSLLKTGGFICAKTSEDIIKIEEEVEKCKKRKIPFQILSYKDAKKMEPNLDPNIIKVLSLPTTKIIYPGELMYAMVENLTINNVDIRKNFKVNKISNQHNSFTIYSDSQKIDGKLIINATGVHVDEIYKLVSDIVDFEILPRKGEYLITDNGFDYMNRVIYPVNSEKGKGILIVPTVHGNYIIGPDANFIDNKDQNSTSNINLNKIIESSQNNVQNLPLNRVIRVFSGIRSTEKNRDFIIEESKFVKNFINVAGIDSPGLSSSVAIAKYVLNIIKEKQTININENYKKGRKIITNINSLSIEERNKKIIENYKYGKMICQCEKVSEQEIINSIDSGARTVKGVKLRVRPLTGVCQGGFCEHEVIRIISEQLDIRLENVLYEDSSILS